MISNLKHIRLSVMIYQLVNDVNIFTNIGTNTVIVMVQQILFILMQIQ